MMTIVRDTVVIGAVATLCIDIWSVFLKRAFGIRSMNYCMLGRWVIHMRHGTFAHADIAMAAAKPGECAVGWSAHYAIGIGFATLFLSIAPDGWLSRPTIVPVLAFGVATVVVPFATVQPAFGLGIASSKAPSPAWARTKSVATHAVFGVGLYAAASMLRVLVTLAE